MTTAAKRIIGKVTHGESKPATPEYEAWHQIKSRCLNPKAKSFKHYGARGIRLCDRWIVYENFIADMGRRPSSDHSIDRRDNDANYEPSNCRWATRSEQQQNKRIGILMNTNTSGVPGVSWFKQTSKWESYHWIKNKKVRLGYFATREEAVAARVKWESTKKGNC